MSLALLFVLMGVAVWLILKPLWSSTFGPGDWHWITTRAPWTVGSIFDAEGGWWASVPIALVLVALASPKGTESMDDAAKQRRTHVTPDAIIGDDAALPGAVGGQKIPLDFKTFAFSNRPALNGIPTTPSLYTADVYVWSTRVKNSVPGYCLGASMPASSLVDGSDPTPLCVTSTAAASAGPSQATSVLSASPRGPLTRGCG